MKSPLIFMYSGQGSQYYQMGKSFYEHRPIFKDALQKADRLCQKWMGGVSIVQQLYAPELNKSLPFQQLLLTHPAIVMIEYALTQVLYENNIFPDMVVGSSLGEFTSAWAAGVFSIEDALEAVIKQAQVLKGLSEASSMLAILSEPSLYQSADFINQNSELASINFNAHFVVSGKNENLHLIMNKLQQLNISCQLLPVEVPFHSSLIAVAKEPYLNAIENLPLHTSNLNTISCMTTSSINRFTHEHFWEVVRQPIQFLQTIRALEKTQPGVYIDMGPAGTLATFVKYILEPNSGSAFFPILTPFGNDEVNLTTLLTHILSIK